MVSSSSASEEAAPRKSLEWIGSGQVYQLQDHLVANISASGRGPHRILDCLRGTLSFF
jgi:hypothetical protein